MTILQEFQMAVKASNMSEIEISWAMKVSSQHFQEILTRIAIITDDQELFMYRFVWKHKKKQA
jgi:hypothetical protein